MCAMWSTPIQALHNHASGASPLNCSAWVLMDREALLVLIGREDVLKLCSRKLHVFYSTWDFADIPCKGIKIYYIIFIATYLKDKTIQGTLRYPSPHSSSTPSTSYTAAFIFCFFCSSFARLSRLVSSIPTSRRHAIVRGRAKARLPRLRNLWSGSPTRQGCRALQTATAANVWVGVAIGKTSNCSVPYLLHLIKHPTAPLSSSFTHSGEASSKIESFIQPNPSLIQLTILNPLPQCSPALQQLDA